MVGAVPADDQAGGEEDQGHGQRGDRAAAVAPAAGGDHADDAAGQRGREGQGVEADAVELAATVGITVVTAVASKATNAQSANMPTVVAAYAGDSSRGGLVSGAGVEGHVPNGRTSTAPEVNRALTPDPAGE